MPKNPIFLLFIFAWFSCQVRRLSNISLFDSDAITSRVSPPSRALRAWEFKTVSCRHTLFGNWWDVDLLIECPSQNLLSPNLEQKIWVQANGGSQAGPPHTHTHRSRDRPDRQWLQQPRYLVGNGRTESPILHRAGQRLSTRVRKSCPGLITWTFWLLLIIKLQRSPQSTNRCWLKE